MEQNGEPRNEPLFYVIWFYSQAIFDKEDKNIQWGKIVYSINGVGKIR